MNATANLRGRLLRNPWAVLTLASLGYFMTLLDVSIVNVALPSIERGLRITEANLPYVVTPSGASCVRSWMCLAARACQMAAEHALMRSAALGACRTPA